MNLQYIMPALTVFFTLGFLGLVAFGIWTDRKISRKSKKKARH